jgi:hypothetical protein
MRYYFAGAYARRVELENHAEALAAANIGAIVVSRWLSQGVVPGDGGFGAAELGSPAAVAAAWEAAQKDLEDLSICEAIVSFTGFGGRGGRHVEHGYAIRLHEEWPFINDNPFPMRLIVIGPREHVFHCHPATEVYRDFDAFLAHEIQKNREETQA